MMKTWKLVSFLGLTAASLVFASTLLHQQEVNSLETEEVVHVEEVIVDDVVTENHTLRLSEKNLGDYSEEEVADYLAVLGDDDQRVLADKGGGYFSTVDNSDSIFEVTDENDETHYYSLYDESVSATIGEIKEHLQDVKDK